MEQRELDRIQWAIKTAPIHPTMWKHEYQGNPLSILIEAAKNYIQSQEENSTA